MGSLSNLYISQSFQSLIHLGSDTTITTASVQLQDGFGNGTGIFVNSLGDVFLSGSLSASLTQGYTWVGDSNNRTKLVSTASFGGTTDLTSLNAFTASQNTKNSTLASVTASLNANTASQQSQINSLIAATASYASTSSIIPLTSLNAYTASNDTKWSNLGGQTGSYATTGANTFNGSQTINGDISASGFVYANFVVTNIGVRTPYIEAGTGNELSLIGDVMTQKGVSITNGLSVTGSLRVTQTFTASLQQGYVWVGDSTGKTTLVATSSFGGGGGGTIPAGTVSSSAQIVELGFLQTSSFNSYTSSTNSSITQLNASSASQQISIDALNAATSSYITTPLTSLNAYTASNDTKWSTLGGQTGSYVTSAITASSLVTASFSGNTLTFTKGDASTFGVVIPDVSGSAGTTIFETVYTGESITKGDPLYISGSQGANPIVYKADAADAAKMPVTFVSNETIGASNTTQAIVLGLIEGIDLTGYTAGQAIYVAEGGGWSTSLPSGSNSVTQLLGVVTKGGSGGKGLVLNPGPAQLPGLDTGKMWVGGSTNQPVEISSASFASTGSNVFTGDQTLVDASGNTVTLSDISGSLVLVAKSYTSASAHISSSANNVNLLFKNNNNTTDTIISGSNNILGNAAAATAGFKKYVSNNNIFLNGQLPEITGSITFSPTVNANIGNGLIRFRAPVSSSAWTLSNNNLNAGFNIGSADATSANQAIAGGNITNNMLLAAVNYNAYTTPLVAAANFQNSFVIGTTTLTAFSSSIQASNNIFNGNAFTINNRYFGTSAIPSAQRLQLAYNVFGGINSSTLTAEGSNTSTGVAREVIGNTTNGSGLSLGVILSGDNSSLLSTLIHGSNLTVTGSSTNNNYNTAGSTFIGRNNAVDGTKASSAETIFAVGTGIGTGARKTGFLIDSGSNTFVDGTFNVTGTTSLNGNLIITGSLTASLQQGYVWVGDAAGKTITVATSSFGGGGAAFPYTGNAQISGSLGVTGSFSGFVNTLVVTGTTASLDFSLGNMFTLTLPSASTTYFNPSNIKAGQTINVQLTQQTPGTGSVSFAPSIKFAGGADYQATATGSAIDLITFISLDGTNVLATSIKNFL
jgi:hypothetical protein